MSLALVRVRSLGSALQSARLAQEQASRRELFDEAKRFRDEAREAEVWLRQTVRDASVRRREYFDTVSQELVNRLCRVHMQIRKHVDTQIYRQVKTG